MAASLLLSPDPTQATGTAAAAAGDGAVQSLLEDLAHLRDFSVRTYACVIG